MKDGITDYLREKIEVLDGSRNATIKGRSAIRVEDMSAILEIESTLKSTKINAIPTAAEYNALHNDLMMLHRALRSLADSIQDASQ
jgi:hypothetical protein